MLAGLNFGHWVGRRFKRILQHPIQQSNANALENVLRIFKGCTPIWIREAIRIGECIQVSIEVPDIAPARGNWVNG